MTRTATPTPFEIWSQRWISLATIRGANIPNPDRSVESVVDLWAESIPGAWQRPTVDPRLIQGGYQRGDNGARHGEHALEHEILRTPGCDRVLGLKMLDGVNAVPLVRAEQGSRRGNVEADLLLLLGVGQGDPRMQVLIEAKTTSNNPWYATVEAARQLRLFRFSSSPTGVQTALRGHALPNDARDSEPSHRTE